MRSFIVMGMFLASFASMAGNDYHEDRELGIDAGGLEAMRIEAGAGTLDVQGIDGLTNIEVSATIVVPDTTDDKAKEHIEKAMELSLTRDGNEATLVSDFDNGFWGNGMGASIDLEVRCPAGVELNIDDGSGSLEVRGVVGGISIDDGSGSIDVSKVGSVFIDDGSGSIDVESASGDVSIIDGSGSIDVRAVEGSVTIDDGSGRIRVSDVENDLIIVDDGSGSVSISNVRGNVAQDT